MLTHTANVPPRSREDWINKAYEKLRLSQGLKVKDLAFKLRLSQSYTRDIVRLLQDLHMVRLEPEKGSAALILFTADYQPPAPKQSTKKPRDTCKYFQVPPEEVWRYAGGAPLPADALIQRRRA